MKGRNRRKLQLAVLFVLLFFIVSTVGLSLISITQVSAPTTEYPQTTQVSVQTGDVEILTGMTSQELPTGVVLTGQLPE